MTSREVKYTWEEWDKAIRDTMVVMAEWDLSHDVVKTRVAHEFFRMLENGELDYHKLFGNK